MPAILFQKELKAAYPEAKVVLIEPEEYKWAKPFDDMMVAPLRMRKRTWLVAPARQLDMGGVVAMVRRNSWKVMETWGANPYDAVSVTRDARKIYRGKPPRCEGSPPGESCSGSSLRMGRSRCAHV